MKPWTSMAFLLMTALSPFAGEAADYPSTQASNNTLRSVGPYCGVYCLYAALRLADREVTFRNLLQAKYIGSRYGSSLGELKQAGEDFSLHGISVANLTTQDLRRCPYPVIMHVKRSPDQERYDHYVMYLGRNGDLAWIFDPPWPVRLVEYQELVPIWDGSALVVATQPIAAKTVFRHAHVAFVLKTVVVGIFVLGVRACTRGPAFLRVRVPQRFAISTIEASSLALASLLLGVLYHSCTSEALLTAPRALALVRRAHQGDFIPRVGIHRTKQLLSRDTVFVDARFSRDYGAGHLDGAINVPVDANDMRRRTTMAGVANDAKIVVYCQSAQCKFAEFVALALLRDGYSDVSVFRGGWREWGERE